MQQRLWQVLLMISIGVLFSGCGQKGELYLPTSTAMLETQGTVTDNPNDY